MLNFFRVIGQLKPEICTKMLKKWSKKLRPKFPATIDPFHKWLPIINSFVIIKINLTNLVFELTIQKNLIYSPKRV